jgi:hypothetical protein
LEKQISVMWGIVGSVAITLVGTVVALVLKA